MGVLLLTCITKKETTKARAISCYSPSLCRIQIREAHSVVESGSAAYSNITAAPHEYFGQTGICPRSGPHAKPSQDRAFVEDGYGCRRTLRVPKPGTWRVYADD